MKSHKHHSIQCQEKVVMQLLVSNCTNHLSVGCHWVVGVNSSDCEDRVGGRLELRDCGATLRHLRSVSVSSLSLSSSSSLQSSSTILLSCNFPAMFLLVLSVIIIFRSARASCTTSVRPVPSALKIWTPCIQAYMPHESSGDSSNQPDGPMGSPRRLP